MQGKPFGRGCKNIRKTLEELKLGLFIVISMIIVIGSLVALGLIEEFKEKNEIFTIFDESVQGLEEKSFMKNALFDLLCTSSTAMSSSINWPSTNKLFSSIFFK